MEISAPLASFQAFLDSAFTFVSEDPVLRGIQALLAFGAFTLVFLIFYATRDILLRTRSLTAQLGCVLLVALFPVVGFLLYLLLRPARTVAERAMEESLQRIEAMLEETRHAEPLGSAQGQLCPQCHGELCHADPSASSRSGPEGPSGPRTAGSLGEKLPGVSGCHTEHRRSVSVEARTTKHLASVHQNSTGFVAPLSASPPKPESSFEKRPMKEEEKELAFSLTS
ncbi:MAG: PLD nuclease N-terminal domain-containing protein [Patescibacteria group bacterium]